jgi:hypothetical protein|eukprot:COSAG01_NODE_839_length_13190_cov_138.958368_10_plen_244_part_00
MSSNHPELLQAYPNPMLDFMPSARAYAKAKSMENVGRPCPGLHYPDVLAPWGAPESGDGVNADAGLMSNGPYSTMPIIWGFEYGARKNLTEIRERWFPLVKGEADFFSCFLQELPANASGPRDSYLHDLGDCTNESPGKCQMRDTVLTLSMMRRSFDVVSDMAKAVGEPVDPKWAAVLKRITPDAIGWFHGEDNGARMGNVTHECSFCASNVSHGPPTSGDCQGASNSNGVIRGICAHSVSRL